jgi:hypothetical protein
MAALPPPAGTNSPALESAYDAPGWMTGWPTKEAENDRGLRPMRVYSQTRWDPTQADAALREAETGQWYGIARFLDAMRRDGLINGIMSVRTSGMLRCPVKFTGDPWLVERLRGRDPQYDERGVLVEPGTPGAFWDMAPESEQAAVLFDGIMAGVGLGELVPRPGKPPRLRHLPLHFLHYRYESDFWWYQTGGNLWAITVDTEAPPVANDPALPPVDPNRGRFVLFTPYGRERPWVKGLWWPCSLPFITRQNVTFDQLRWQQNLADPLKVIEAQEGADEKHRMWLLQFVQTLWRRAAGLVSPPKYKASLVESNGRGYEVYQQGYDQAAKDLQITLAGSTVAVEGGSGFVNASIYKDIASDKTAMIAEAWSTCLHEQMIRPWTALLGQERDRAPWSRWDIRSPESKLSDAQALGALAEAIDKLDVTLARRGRSVDLEALLEEAGQNLPTRPLLPGVVAPPLGSKDEPAPKESAPPVEGVEEPEGASPPRGARAYDGRVVSIRRANS